MKKTLQPNKAAMLQHLQFLFKDTAEYSDGRIEIAYTPSDTGAVSRAEWFDITDLEAAADFAHRINSTEGVNVYIGAAVRDPDSMPGGRSSIADYYAASTIWCDLDDPGVAAAARGLYSQLPPSMAVVTGRHPDMRAQVWWKLSEHEKDPILQKSNLAHICSVLKGDKAVVDSARVMRLGGSVAWPKKDGRIPELTEVKIPDNATSAVSSEAFKSYFPVADAPLTEKPAVGGVDQSKRLNIGGSGFSHDDVIDMLDSISPDCVYQEWISVGMALNSNNMDFSVWDNWSGRGSKYPGQKEMLYKWNTFKGTGTTIGTIYYLAKANGYQGRPTPPEPEPKVDPITGEIITPAGVTATSLDDIDLDNIAPREFLFGTVIGRKYVTMIVAPPGAGKSIFTMQMALYAAAGKPWGDMDCKKPLKVWVYNNEEGMDELKRRIKGVLIDSGMTKEEISGRFFIDSGEIKSINIAKLGANGVIATPDFDQLKAEVIARGIDVLIVDPFAETHSVNENSNDEIKRVAGLYRQIAFEANCAVLLVHHTRKGMEGSNSQQAGNADMARGGGAQTGVVRRMFTLSTMTEKTAQEVGIPEDKRRWYVRFDDAKTNITAPAERTEWFKFKSVSLNNGRGIYPDGDSVGVLEAVNMEDMKADFADEKHEERDSFVFMVIQQMDAMGWTSAAVKDVAAGIIAAGKVSFKDQAVRRKITDYVKVQPKNKGIPFNGMYHYVSVSEDKGANNSSIITVKRVEI